MVTGVALGTLFDGDDGFGTVLGQADVDRHLDDLFAADEFGAADEATHSTSFTASDLVADMNDQGLDTEATAAYTQFGDVFVDDLPAAIADQNAQTTATDSAESSAQRTNTVVQDDVSENVL